MTSSLTPNYRRFAALIALIGWAALIAQLIFLLILASRLQGSLVETVWRFFGAFTVTTNLLIAAVMTAAARGRVLLPWPGEASLLAGTAVSGVFLMLAFHVMFGMPGFNFLLGALGIALHDLVPCLALLLWLAGAPKAPLGFGDPFRWLIYPAAYLVYCWTRGAIDGWYPYYFLDVGHLGYGRALLMALALGAGFALVGLALVLVARVIRRLRPEPAMA
jgi:hypothetical protein